MRNNGFTLVELILASAILVIVSLLGFTAVQSSSRSININQSTSRVQDDARNVMLALTQEIEFAVKPAAMGLVLPPGVVGIEVRDNGRSVTFQIPTDNTFTRFSAPITFRFETEDALIENEPGYEFGNALLDAGEDLNNDGVLNRRIVRVQSGVTSVVGSANTIADAVFELLPEEDVLRVTITATQRIERDRPHLFRYQLQNDIYIMN